MSSSWTNSSVTVSSINKNASEVPILTLECLFAAPDNKSFFQFGGESNNDNPPTVSVAQFTLSGKGNGSWSDFNAGSLSGFDNITRTSHALAATVEDTFFMLGGLINSRTSHETNDMSGSDYVSVGGVLAFNMTTGKWTNSSMPSELVRPRGKNGILNSVPSFGSMGLLLAAGVGTVDDAPRSFDNITMYELSNRTWHYQSATGDIPAGRDGACSVGVQGDNGTYEM